jgi:Ca2+/Na+ antiporter
MNFSKNPIINLIIILLFLIFYTYIAIAVDLIDHNSSIWEFALLIILYLSFIYMLVVQIRRIINRKK